MTATVTTASSGETITEVLGRPLTLPNGQVVKNRIMKSAMSEALAPANHRVPDTIPRLYERWARGHVGLSVTGNVMIDRQAIGEPGNIVVDDERDIDQLRAWAEAGKSEGGLIYMQLNHPGRQVPIFLNEESVAPSAVPFRPEMRRFLATPRALEADEIEDQIQRFATTAAIAERAGFDGVQIHGAHGYLVAQFLSPHTNRRDDEWGGSPEKRRRFALEVYRAIREATSDGFGVAIKINSADFQKGGFTEEESRDTILALASEGMDLVEISGGTYEAPEMVSPRESTRSREAYFLSFAQSLRETLDVPLAVTGGFRSGGAMAEAVAEGAIDLAGLGRTLAIAPDFPKRLLTEGDAHVELTPRDTGIGFLDRIGMFELVWYERQLHRMGNGQEPRPNEHPLYSAIAHSLTHGLRAFRIRRAK